MRRLALTVALSLVALLTAAAPLAVPACWPSNVGGTGTAIATGVLPTPPGGGSWAGWWCPDGSGGWTKVAMFARNVNATAHPSTLVGLSPTDLAAAYWALNTREPVTANEKAQHAAAQAALDPLKPKSMAWIVPDASPAPRMRLPWRQYYLLDTPAPAPAGWVCDCSTLKIVQAAKLWSEPPVMEPTDETYCPLRSTTMPEIVAPCRWLEAPPEPAVGEAIIMDFKDYVVVESADGVSGKFVLIAEPDGEPEPATVRDENDD